MIVSISEATSVWKAIALPPAVKSLLPRPSTLRFIELSIPSYCNSAKPAD